MRYTFPAGCARAASGAVSIKKARTVLSLATAGFIRFSMDRARVCPTLTLTGRGERMRASGPVERVVGRRQSDSIVEQDVSRTQLPRLAAVPHSIT